MGKDCHTQLEDAWNSLRQDKREQGAAYLVRVLQLAKQLEPPLPEGLILSKLRSSIHPAIWREIPWTEKCSIEKLQKFIALYDKENESEVSSKYPTQEEGYRQLSRQSSDFQGKPFCRVCRKSGHSENNCYLKRKTTAVAQNKNYDSNSINSATYVNGMVGNIPVAILIDFGAFASLFSEKFLDTHKIKFHKKNCNVITVLSQAADVIGKVLLKFSVGSRCCTWEFLVLEKMSTPLLLGTD